MLGETRIEIHTKKETISVLLVFSAVLDTQQFLIKLKVSAVRVSRALLMTLVLKVIFEECKIFTYRLLFS